MITQDQDMTRSRSKTSLNIVCLFGDIFDNVIAPFLSWWDIARMQRCSTRAKKDLMDAVVHCFGAPPERIWDDPIFTEFPKIRLHSFNCILGVVIFTHAKQLNMYDGFSEYIPTDMFPKTLESMRLNKSYGQRITPGIFPSSLKELYFDEYFNEVIMPGVLPKGLKRLGFYDDMNTPYTASSKFNQRIEPGLLPQGLEELQLGTGYTEELLLGSLPASLTSLKCWTRSFNLQSRRNYELFGAGVLPPNLKSLVLGDILILPGALPIGLREIEFHCNTLLPLRSHGFPNSVIKLTLGGDFNQRMSDFELPPNLQELAFGDYFNQNLLPGILPETLTCLHLGREFNTELKVGSLPTKLQILTFGPTYSCRYNRFNQKLIRHVIPVSVCVLDLGLAYRFPLTRGVLSCDLQRLYLGEKYPEQQQWNRKLLGCPLVDITLYNRRRRTLPNRDPIIESCYVYSTEPRGTKNPQ